MVVTPNTRVLESTNAKTLLAAINLAGNDFFSHWGTTHLRLWLTTYIGLQLSITLHSESLPHKIYFVEFTEQK